MYIQYLSAKFISYLTLMMKHIQKVYQIFIKQILKFSVLNMLNYLKIMKTSLFFTFIDVIVVSTVERHCCLLRQMNISKYFVPKKSRSNFQHGKTFFIIFYGTHLKLLVRCPDESEDYRAKINFDFFDNPRELWFLAS